jgi:selenide,water dikinase
LEIILEGLSPDVDDPDILVGFEGADDAGVYRIDEDRALVLTVDVITPIVDDPRTFGRIAAANALSDVYAMGGTPLAALNVSCFVPGLPPEVYRELLSGANDIAREAGCPILGGHTIKDQEIKFGLAVVGEVHPERIMTNAAAREGDRLILTKPLGTSAAATAFKQEALNESDPVYAAVVASMTQLNGGASGILVEHGARALTDVTGFGLSGHALEMATASGVTLEIEAEALPGFEGALDLLAQGYTCGGGKANEARAAENLEVAPELLPEENHLLHDPQTSGPLLASVPKDRADSALATLRAAGYPHASLIGRATARGTHHLRVQ